MGIRIWPACILLTLSAACSTIDVHSDHDPKADFSKFRSYSWLQRSPRQAPPDLSGLPSPLFEGRIREAVDTELNAKGLKKVRPEDGPDLWVSDAVVQRQSVETQGGSQVGFAYGGWGYGFYPWAGFSVPGYGAKTVVQGTLVIDLTEASDGRLVWRGMATDAVRDPEESAKDLREAVAATLKQYPPKGIKES